MKFRLNYLDQNQQNWIKSKERIGVLGRFHTRKADWFEMTVLDSLFP